MKFTKISFLLLVFFLLNACRSNMICPAYQSTYILDMYKKRSTYEMKERTYYTTHLLYDSIQMSTEEDSLRRMQFTHFVDSVPFSRYQVKKSKNGRVTRVKVARNDINREAYKRRKDLIAEYDYLPGFDKAHWYRKHYDQQLISMEDQFIAPVDSAEDIEVGFFVAEDFVGNDSLSIASTDSLGTDSLAVAQSVTETPLETQPTERYRFGYEFGNNKYNEDQDYYNKEFGHLLVMKVQPATAPVEEMTEEAAASDSTSVKKKGFMSRFRKNKDSTDEAVPEDENAAGEEEQGNN